MRKDAGPTTVWIFWPSGNYEANERMVSTLLAIGPHFTLSVSRTFCLLLCLR